MTYKKKLIEVALPLEAINKAAAKEKSIRHGHPSTLHLWWARRPLAACRAVLFASLVDDPSNFPDRFPTEKAQEKERHRLFKIIEDLVLWENTNNERVLDAARKEILKSTDGNPPPVLDPFCGGGSIPLEAQRLGLEAHASDLNPVAVLITKALIEIPPKFAGRPPVNPKSRGEHLDKHKWHGAEGLADDVRYYGQWMRDEAERRIGHLYPKVRIPTGRKGKEEEATVIAWLWARTVKCPNPACGARMPLARSFWLSRKKDKNAWADPVVDKRAKTVSFVVKTGRGAPTDGTVSRKGATCAVCGMPASLDYVRSEAQSGRMQSQLVAISAESGSGRVYVSPTEEYLNAVFRGKPTWKPEQELQGKCRVSVPLYGMATFADLFTSRQLIAMSTFSDLAREVEGTLLGDAVAAGLPDDGIALDAGGTGAIAWTDAVTTYIALGVSKLSDYNSSLVVWSQNRDQAKSTFARQALPMVWDFAEVNPFAGAAGDFAVTLAGICETIERLTPAAKNALVSQLDAAALQLRTRPCVSTDPPYYNNIGYADLSDFFYVWLRRCLSKTYPSLFSTVLVPKAQELVATPYRFDGDTARAQRFFEEGLGNAFGRIRAVQDPDYPLTVYYAFKQSEEDEVIGEEETNPAVASTGWETMLHGLLKSCFQITGTWPMRTERIARSVGIGTNALASSIVLVCRPRRENAPLATRREFVVALRQDLPHALAELVQGGIAPVDLAQAAIGPGMAVFSRYAKVLEADGSAMSVRTALQTINQHLDEYFAEQEGDVDSDTRFAVAWFEQYGMKDGPFGEADVLARAKNTSVQGVVDSGILLSKAGKVRLRARKEYPDDWDPVQGPHFVVWKCTQHLIKALLEEGGEKPAAELARRLGGKADDARALAYRLFHICERRKLADEALAYNSLVVSWSGLSEKAGKTKKAGGREVQRDDLV